MTATVGQIAIDPKMPRIKHLINRLDHQSNLVSNWEVSLAMGSSFQGHWRSTGNHSLRRDRSIKKDSFFFFLREIEELRQVYNLQSIQVTERKVLLNCKFPMAVTKGNANLYKI